MRWPFKTMKTNAFFSLTFDSAAAKFGLSRVRDEDCWQVDSGFSQRHHGLAGGDENQSVAADSGPALPFGGPRRDCHVRRELSQPTANWRERLGGKSRRSCKSLATWLLIPGGKLEENLLSLFRYAELHKCTERLCRRDPGVLWSASVYWPIPLLMS